MTKDIIEFDKRFLNLSNKNYLFNGIHINLIPLFLNNKVEVSFRCTITLKTL